jgi:hypothetical protein
MSYSVISKGTILHPYIYIYIKQSTGARKGRLYRQGSQVHHHNDFELVLSKISLKDVKSTLMTKFTVGGAEMQR